jgi:DNA-binding transcriptional LysR family regulator
VNLKQLEALVYVARCGTFRQAAESLYFDSDGDEYITPESVQYRLKQLEKDLGVALYRKRQGSARVTLTREGMVFLREAVDVYQRMAGWRGLFSRNGQEWLTFASTQAILLHRLRDRLSAFAREMPQVRIRAIASTAQEMEQMVDEGRVDFAISTRPPERQGLEYVVWRRSGMVLITPQNHPLARRKAVRLEEIAEHPLVVLEPELRGDRELMDEAFRKAGIRRPNVVVETSNSELIKAYVEAGLGLGIIAETNVSGGAATRRVGVVPLGNLLGRTESGLLVREGQFISPAMRKFLSGLDPVLDAWVKEHETVTKDPEMAASGDEPPA